jgi:two-component system sensor histidine kinase UhpB
MGIQDDGRGFEAPAAGQERPAGHYGLRFMADRAAEMGGTLEVSSTPGRGTDITVHVPLHPAEDGHAAAAR